MSDFSKSNCKLGTFTQKKSLLVIWAKRYSNKRFFTDIEVAIISRTNDFL